MHVSFTVSQHGQKLLKNVHSDVVELSENLQRVRSGQTTLSSILERRDARGMLDVSESAGI